MKTPNAVSTTSGVRDDDALDHVGDVLACVDSGLEQRVDVLPLDDRHRVGAVREELGNRLARDAIALVLEPMDLDPVLLNVFERVKLLEGLDDLLALPDDDVGLVAGGIGR